jgi:hypothetical protein
MCLLLEVTLGLISSSLTMVSWPGSQNGSCHLYEILLACMQLLPYKLLFVSQL